jgi:microcystin-dependent protein
MAAHASITERGVDGVAVERPIPASQPGDTFPAGTVVDFAGSAAPTGWLICDGAAVSRATYPQLFANLGTTFGAGDGSTTFNLPDCRGKVVAGKHSSGTFNTLGASGGEETHVTTVSEMPSHNHGGATNNSVPFNTSDQSNDHLHGVAQTDLYNNGAGGGPGRAQGSLVGAGGGPYSATGPTATGGTNVGHVHSVGAHTHGISSQGGGAGHNNLQPYIVLNKIIRAY